MNTTVMPTSTTEPPFEPRHRKRSRGALLFFTVLWIVLISAGVYGAKTYSDHIQQQVTIKLEQQTNAQLTRIEQDYTERIGKLEQDVAAQFTALEDQLQVLNELLTFAKDNADNNTDNSNKLYSQLAEVKKQLNALKKNLDVLK